MLQLRKNRAGLRRSRKDEASGVHFTNVEISDFHAPLVTGHYQAQISLADAGDLLKLKTGLKAAGSLALDGDARFASTADYSLAGAVRVTDLSVNQFHNVRLDGHLDAQPGKYLLNGDPPEYFRGADYRDGGER